MRSLFVCLVNDQLFATSTSRCPLGEGCHFLHYVPGGIKNAFQMHNTGSSPALPPPSRSSGLPPSFPDGSSPDVKNQLCKKFNSAEGCKFGDKCHYSNGEWDLGRSTGPSYEDPRSMSPIPGRMGRQMEPQHQVMSAASSLNVRQGNVHGHGQGPPMKQTASYGPGASNFKTKVCKNFSKGSCTFGDRCHLAHGNEELRK